MITSVSSVYSVGLQAFTAAEKLFHIPGSCPLTRRTLQRYFIRSYVR